MVINYHTISHYIHHLSSFVLFLHPRHIVQSNPPHSHHISGIPRKYLLFQPHSLAPHRSHRHSIFNSRVSFPALNALEMADPNRHSSMYGSEAMNLRTQIDDDDEDDDVAGAEESIDNPQARFEGHVIEDRAVVVMNGVQDVHPNHMFVPGSDFAPVAGGGGSGAGGVDQLTLSFQGEVYVFDAVSPEKVQAVLLLLGGYEVPTGIPATGMVPPNQRGLTDFTGRSSQPQRAASLSRFREKRKERCFDKKIRYTVRKEVALRMQRKKGQFTSSKTSSDEVGGGTSSDWNAAHGSGQEEPETLCTHCGTSSKTTPMMRRGPAGPRTLCNACGLKWANKGILRDLSRVPIVGAQDTSLKATQSNGDVNDSGAITAVPDVVSSNGDNSAVTAER